MLGLSSRPFRFVRTLRVGISGLLGLSGMANYRIPRIFNYIQDAKLALRIEPKNQAVNELLRRLMERNAQLV